MNISDLLPAAWPEQVRAATDAFYQGAVIEKPPIFYGAAPAHPVCSFTNENADQSRATQVMAVPSSRHPAFGIVTSQTCDICEAGNPTNPFIQVSPVIDLRDRLTTDQQSQLRAYKYTDFVYLTRQPASDGFFVADLRISLPIEKGFLVGQDPIDGFANERDRLNFGERLAARLRRPAFGDVLHELVIHGLNGWIASDEVAARREGSGRFTDVEEVRLRLDGDRLSPTSLQVVVFMESDLSAADRKPWRDWQRRTKRQLHKLNGPEFKPVQFATMEKLSAREYRRLAPIWLSNLGREPRS